MEILINAKNPLIGKNITLNYSIDYCEYMNDYVVHRNLKESTHGCGRYDSYNEAFNAIYENAKKAGFEF